jgi:hypothetical protein
MTSKPDKWTLQKRWSDIRSNGLIEVICQHGIGHHNGIHGCDGCCAICPDELWEKVTNDNIIENDTKGTTGKDK